MPLNPDLYNWLKECTVELRLATEHYYEADGSVAATKRILPKLKQARDRLEALIVLIERGRVL